jgi:hypothetical protein
MVIGFLMSAIQLQLLRATVFLALIAGWMIYTLSPFPRTTLVFSPNSRSNVFNGLPVEPFYMSRRKLFHHFLGPL